MINSKNAYEFRLHADCEVWLKNNYYNLHQQSYSNNPTFPYTAEVTNGTNRNLEEQLPTIQLAVATGPWKSLYVHFKEPGDNLTMVEKILIDHLRDEGHRVIIVRYMEDFKTSINMYLA